MALVNKGARLGALGRGEEEIAVYDDLLHRFGSVSATDNTIRQQVAQGLCNKMVRLRELDRREDEIAVYNDLLRFGRAMGAGKVDVEVPGGYRTIDRPATTSRGKRNSRNS